jgi:2-pyrone-4,6-dicarboxylate lactonase
MKKEVPDDGILVDYVPSIATSAALQEKLLVTNPNNLYWS